MKLAVTSFTRNKWQKEWDEQTENRLKEIKPCIEIWPAFSLRKVDVILTHLRKGH